MLSKAVIVVGSIGSLKRTVTRASLDTPAPGVVLPGATEEYCRKQSCLPKFATGSQSVKNWAGPACSAPPIGKTTRKCTPVTVPPEGLLPACVTCA